MPTETRSIDDLLRAITTTVAELRAALDATRAAAAGELELDVPAGNGNGNGSGDRLEGIRRLAGQITNQRDPHRAVLYDAVREAHRAGATNAELAAAIGRTEGRVRQIVNAG